LLLIKATLLGRSNQTVEVRDEELRGWVAVALQLFGASGTREGGCHDRRTSSEGPTVGVDAHERPHLVEGAVDPSFETKMQRRK
jgi:hypothetical protein